MCRSCQQIDHMFTPTRTHRNVKWTPTFMWGKEVDWCIKNQQFYVNRDHHGEFSDVRPWFPLCEPDPRVDCMRFRTWYFLIELVYDSVGDFEEPVWCIHDFYDQPSKEEGEEGS